MSNRKPKARPTPPGQTRGVDMTGAVETSEKRVASSGKLSGEALAGGMLPSPFDVVEVEVSSATASSSSSGRPAFPPPCPGHDENEGGFADLPWVCRWGAGVRMMF